MSNERVNEIRSIEHRLEHILRDLRIVRAGIEQDIKDKGVLGSRALTEFIVDLVLSGTKPAWPIQELLFAAEQQGYAVPVARTMSKRLTEQAYRKGRIQWSKHLGGWAAATTVATVAAKEEK